MEQMLSIELLSSNKPRNSSFRFFILFLLFLIRKNVSFLRKFIDPVLKRFLFGIESSRSWAFLKHFDRFKKSSTSKMKFKISPVILEIPNLLR